jgi:hypothetical protein
MSLMSVFRLIFFLFDLSEVATGKRAGRKRGWPLTVTDRGLPLSRV